MLEIDRSSEGRIRLRGRFDASQKEHALQVFKTVSETTVVDMGELSYISSLGLGILMQTQKRLNSQGAGGLKLINVSPHIQEILQVSGFHTLFEIEGAGD